MLTLALACHEAPTKPPVPTTGSESDADADADSDADTDPGLDSAADTGGSAHESGDTGAVSTSPITGRWVGDCSTYYTPYGPKWEAFSFDLDLTESAGAVDGHGRLDVTEAAQVGSTGGSGFSVTTYSFGVPIATTGTWDGADLELALVDQYGSPMGLGLTGPVRGATWSATFANFGSSGYAPIPCTLTLQ